jgi:phosphohistidine phosphatase SixA
VTKAVDGGHYGFAVPVYLVRHAHAGNRSSWDGDDATRPLSPKGRLQSAGLLEWLTDEPIARVLSSPATRCIETVEPLAEARGLTVETDGWLAEGSGARPCIEAILALGEGGVALCSHGDLIPKVIRQLRADGMDTKDPNLSQKGSTWVLEVVDGRVASGRYRPPPKA